jgi:isoaspartyl peptidase/L-asparaginase-like protein (Ntn-hydrolase superfamily)
MERTTHIYLVGEGARLFALQEGFTLECLLTPETLTEWYKSRPARRRNGRDPGRDPGRETSGDWQPSTGVEVRPQLAAERRTKRVARGEGRVARKKPVGKRKKSDDQSLLTTRHSPLATNNHDTVAVLALDQKGDLGGVCTTSGLSHKLPGRVGDSPIIGSGLYVDNTAGAAGGTGVGEEIIRIGGSMIIVEAMRAGRSPQEACEAAIRKLNTVAARRGVHPAEVAFIALDPKGRIGAACTSRYNFQYALGRGTKIELHKAVEVNP